MACAGSEYLYPLSGAGFALPSRGNMLELYQTNKNMQMFEESGIRFGTARIVLLALYFIIKWAVKNGIKEAYRDITGKVTTEDIEAEQICNEEEK